jgi:hypothetical protein
MRLMRTIIMRIGECAFPASHYFIVSFNPSFSNENIRHLPCGGIHREPRPRPLQRVILFRDLPEFQVLRQRSLTMPTYNRVPVLPTP